MLLCCTRSIKDSALNAAYSPVPEELALENSCVPTKSKQERSVLNTVAGLCTQLSPLLKRVFFTHQSDVSFP